MMQKTKMLWCVAQLILAKYPTKPVHCADMRNVPAQAHKKIVPAGSHGVIYAPQQHNMLIGNLLHLHAVAPRDYDKQK